MSKNPNQLEEAEGKDNSVFDTPIIGSNIFTHVAQSPIALQS
jgi:hypothetical protein